MVPPAVPDDANPYAAPKARVRQPRSNEGERPLASRLSRLVAILIDGLIVAGMVLPVLFTMDIPFTEDGELDVSDGIPTGLLVAYGIIIVFTLLQWFLLWTRSQTLGKIVMKVRIDVYGEDRRAGPLKTVLLRFFVFTIITIIPIVGLLISFLNPLFIFGKERRCLHDLLAGTVVREAP